MIDYYKLLGVSPSVSQEELRKRFRFLVLAFHPDRFLEPRAKELAEQELKLINQAYEVLSDPIKRSNYDFELQMERMWATTPEAAQPKPPPSPPPTPAQTEPPEPIPYQGPRHAWVLLSLVTSILIIIVLAQISSSTTNDSYKKRIASNPRLVRPNLAFNMMQATSTAKPFKQLTQTASAKTVQAINKTLVTKKTNLALYRMQPTLTVEPFKQLTQTASAKTVQAINKTIPVGDSPSPAMAEGSCTPWSRVTAADAGKTMCVYGNVLETYFSEARYYIDYDKMESYYLKPMYIIAFSRDEKAFRFADRGYSYPDLKDGDCVIGSGIVKMFQDMPYIELTRQLDNCS